MNEITYIPSPEKWPELHTETRPMFPIQYLPEDCARQAQNIADSMAAPIDYVACAILGAASSALVGRVSVQVNQTWREYCQLYLGMVGKSGTKKTPVMNAICDPLREWFDKHGISSRQIPEGMGSPVEEITTDATSEALLMDLHDHDGRGVILSDEGAILSILAGTTYGKPGNAQNIDVVLQAFNGGKVRCRRKGENSDIRIDHAHLSIMVGLQPNMLKSFTNNEYLNERGLPQRFLFFIPEATGRCIIDELPEIDMKLLEKWAEKITTLAASFRDRPLNLPLSMNAQAAYRRYAQVMEDRRGVEWCESDAQEAWASKLLGMTARLAGILALLKDPAATLVDENEYEYARSMMEEYFIPHMRYAFCGEHKLSATAEIVLKNMIGCLTRKKRYVLVSTLWDKLRGKHGFPKNGGSQVLDKDLAELAAAGMIRPAETAVAPTGRPSKGAWEVRPELLANVPALQPRRTGAELSKYFPQYLSGPKSMAEAREAMQQDQEDDGLPF